MKALITGANSLVNLSLLKKLVRLDYEVTAHYHSDNEITKQIKRLSEGIIRPSRLFRQGKLSKVYRANDESKV